MLLKHFCSWRVRVGGPDPESGFCGFVGKKGKMKLPSPASRPWSPANPNWRPVKRANRTTGRLWLLRALSRSCVQNGPCRSNPFSAWSWPGTFLLYWAFSRLKCARIVGPGGSLDQSPRLRDEQTEAREERPGGPGPGETLPLLFRTTPRAHTLRPLPFSC
uniref:Uncharacterized protein n=1 Tax=Rousettus aegyptiacus TaxID=9407 RepID=A0A7J8D693_ROUAE|nr:hypothetical protein HJG63_008796 [Rousettus aegyptiacus]